MNRAREVRILEKLLNEGTRILKSFKGTLSKAWIARRIIQIGKRKRNQRSWVMNDRDDEVNAKRMRGERVSLVSQTSKGERTALANPTSERYFKQEGSQAKSTFIGS